NYRNISLGKHHFQRNEHSVVISPRMVYACREPRGGKRLCQVCRQVWLAGGRILKLISVRRKTVVIVDEGWTLTSRQLEFILQPVAGHQNNCCRFCRQFGPDSFQESGHVVPGICWLPV